MFLKDLKIRNFRNIPKLDLNFDDKILYIYSPNGTGKTNILEAIQCLSIGKSLRAGTEKNIFDFNKNRQKVLLTANIEDEDEIVYQSNYLLLGEPKFKKELYINKNKLSINNFIGRSPSIWFSPESIKIISSSPLSKRAYFDTILIQLFPEYYHHLKSYNRSLKQRNKLLQSDFIDRELMKVWTEQLILHGSNIIKQRQSFYEMINTEFETLEAIKRYAFKIEPKPNVALDPVFNEDAEFKFKSELQNSYKRDLEFRSTSVGPHKDSWEILIKIGKNKDFISAEDFASRGQQRMSLMLLQIALINIFIRYKNLSPIMLLDDIFSELDYENETILLDFLKEYNIQTFITGVHKLKDKKIKQLNLVEKLKSPK